MGDANVLQSVREAHRPRAAAFDLNAAKLLRPLVRPETISRSWLIERLARSDFRPIVPIGAMP